MKILSIGAGSMGRRRLRDLTYLNRGEVILFEPAEARCREIAAAFGVRGFTKLDDALNENPSVMTVSTPPALHGPYVKKAVELGLHVFAEVPFVMDVPTLSEVARKAKTSGKVLGVSHTAHYYPPFRIIHDQLKQGAIGKPLYVEYTLGNYLPDWHPYEDYRKFYGADAKLGGAGMDMVLHETNTIQWWFGKIDSVQARLTKISGLEISGADSQDVLMDFASGARGYFHNDVIEQGTVGRHIRIAGDAGTIEWHQNQPSVRVFRDKSNRALTFDQAADWDAAVAASTEIAGVIARQKAKSGAIPSDDVPTFNYESCYLREMRHFMDAAEGKHAYSMANVDDELHTVRVFDAILRSADGRRVVSVEGGGVVG